jgi:hypothetical protein
MCWVFTDSSWFRELYWVFAIITMFNIKGNYYVLSASIIFAICSIGFTMSKRIERVNQINNKKRYIEMLNRDAIKTMRNIINPPEILVVG